MESKAQILKRLKEKLAKKQQQNKDKYVKEYVENISERYPSVQHHKVYVL